jgi:hypothetical protein
VTDSRSPAWFEGDAARASAIAQLRFVECPGTYDDRAYLALGRMIRAAESPPMLPEDARSRSGAVELVLAGSSLTIRGRRRVRGSTRGLDEDGFEPDDYAADSPMTAAT